jgi:hypothetical protein
LGGVFFPLASLAKQLRSPTMRLFYRLASRKNTLAEIDNLSFTRSLTQPNKSSTQVRGFIFLVCSAKMWL